MQRGMAAWCGEKAMDAQGGQSHIQCSSGLDWALGQGSYFPTPLPPPPPDPPRSGFPHFSSFPNCQQSPRYGSSPRDSPISVCQQQKTSVPGPWQKSQIHSDTQYWGTQAVIGSSGLRTSHIQPLKRVQQPDSSYDIMIIDIMNIYNHNFRTKAANYH